VDNKYVILTKKELLKKAQNNKFNELFLSQPKKARNLINDLWQKMTPVPQNNSQRILFENVYLSWQYTVEGEIK